jgi:tripartite-type tricarboxylate transporter receptor subunit TctC
MNIPRRGFLRLSAAAAALPATSRIVQAETYPARPITLVVGASAGGPTDTIGRIITERMRMSLGTTIVIENNGSAAGSAHGRVARAAPDGYTLSLGHWGTHVVNGAVYALTYDVYKDFEPVALISSNPYLMVGRLTLPADDLRGLVGWLKVNPVTATQGTSGAGSPGHIGGIMLQSILGVTWQFIPYRGASPVMQDLVAGQFDFTFTPPDQGMPQIRAGRIKVFAVSAKERLGIAPDVPTTDEAGLPGFYLSYWHGLWAPRGTPKDVVARLNAAVADALADLGVRQRLGELGQQVYPREQQSPEGLAALQKADIDKWWPMIKAANIRAE